MLDVRSSGILLHLTSLASRFGVGDLGPESYRFADFLSDAGQSYWQVLPLNATNSFCGYSPYSGISAFATSTILISPEKLVEDGLLEKSFLDKWASKPRDVANYDSAWKCRREAVAHAYETFKKRGKNNEFEKFCETNSWWLEDYILFALLRDKFPTGTWAEWPGGLNSRSPEALLKIRNEYVDVLNRKRFAQYIFDMQWHSLREYCTKKNISIIGDIPIYVNYDSADVWCHREVFNLDENGKPYAVAGVPPDYFSSTGQLWGNPLYRWDYLKTHEFDWWMKRFERNSALFDVTRIDHFRGFVGYWEVPAGETTAIKGKWVEAPAKDFFATFKKKFSKLSIIAEDLGIITDDVRAVMNEFDIPGMKTLIFAFGGDPARNPYMPQNHVKNSVVYTGTHDTNSICGWFEKEASNEEKENLKRFFGRGMDAKELTWEMIATAMNSVSNTAIIPMQDVLLLSEASRMNTPSMKEGNWLWRLLPSDITKEITDRLRKVTVDGKRC